MLPNEPKTHIKRQRLIPLTDELIQDMLAHEDTEFQTPPGGHINETVGDGKINLRIRQATILANEVRRAVGCTTLSNFANIAANDGGILYGNHGNLHRKIKTSLNMPIKSSRNRSQDSKPIAITTSRTTAKTRSVSNKRNESSPIKCELKPNKKQSDKSKLSRETTIISPKQYKGEKKKSLTKGKIKTINKEVEKRLEGRRKSPLSGSPTPRATITVLTKAADKIEKEMTKQQKEIEIGLEFCNDLRSCSSRCALTPTQSVQHLVDKLRTNFSLPRDSATSILDNDSPFIKFDSKLFMDDEEFSEHFKRKNPIVLDDLKNSLNSIDKTIYDLHNIVSIIEAKHNDIDDGGKSTELIDQKETEYISEDSSTSDDILPIPIPIESDEDNDETYRNRGMELYYGTQLQQINLLALPKSDTSLDMNRHKIVTNILSHTNQYYQTNDFDVVRQYVAADHLRTGQRVSKTVGKKSPHL